MDVLMTSHLALLCGYQACLSINQQMGSLGGGAAQGACISSTNRAGVALAGRGHLDAFSLYGAPSFGSGHSVTRDTDRDNSLRHHIHVVIDELRPTALPLPPLHTVPASIEQVWGGILHTALFFFN